MRSKLSSVHIPDNISVWNLIQEQLQLHSERNKVALVSTSGGITSRKHKNSLTNNVFIFLILGKLNNWIINQYRTQ